MFGNSFVMNGIHDCAWTDCLISERINTVLRHHHLLPPADIKACGLELVIKTFPEAFSGWCYSIVLRSLDAQSVVSKVQKTLSKCVQKYQKIYILLPNWHTVQSQFIMSQQRLLRCSMGKLTLQSPQAMLRSCLDSNLQNSCEQFQ